MKNFAYEGRTRSGRRVQGFLKAENEEVAATKLRREGYYITSLKEAVRPAPFGFQRRIRLKAKNLALFCRQFAIMLGTGLTLVESLELLEGQAVNPAFAEVLEEIRLEVASGTAFTKALERHRRVFPHVFIYLVEAGETAGALPEVLERLALYYEREDELRKKLSEALMYPGIITAVSLLMVIVLLFVVLPLLVKNFAGLGVETPALTVKVLNVKDWFTDYWYVVFAACTAIILGLRAYLRTKQGRFLKDYFLLALPALGEMQKMVIFSRFCRTLSLLLSSGIAMIPTLQILERLMDNSVVKKAVQEAAAGVERGQGISTPLAEHKVFPNMLIQMVAVGEETGNLETVLVQLADYYDREVNFAVASFTKVLEPVIMLLLAIVVLFILISVYLPMMEMVTAI
ncbi:MAG: type II secretion system F family protein [Firmicutes bacterium]|nr:type II secretion system F family protein [Bacillota bacterium]